MSHIIYVGQDMLGLASPGLYGLDEFYACEAAQRGHHYFFYDGDLDWLKPFEEQREESLKTALLGRYDPPPSERVNGWLLCGTPPEPGSYAWNPKGEKFVYLADGSWEKVEEPTPVGPTWQEKLAAKIFCPACFLPRFVPGHKLRGCNGEWGW